MNKVVFGSLVAASLVFGCSKEKSEEKPAQAKGSLRGASRARARKPAAAPAPTNVCHLAQGEHARPPSFTFQNGLAVEIKDAGKDDKATGKDKDAGKDDKATGKDKDAGKDKAVGKDDKAKPVGKDKATGKDKAYAGTTDATIEKAAPTTNAGDDPTLVQKGGKNPRHSLLRWDLSAVPATTTIEGACMAVFIEDPSVQAYAVWELLRDWSESKVTWTSATAENAWATPGAWGGKDSDNEATSIPAKATGLQTLALPTSLVQKWINEQATNHGLIIANDRSFDGLTISSANSPTASQRPTLLIWK